MSRVLFFLGLRRDLKVNLETSSEKFIELLEKDVKPEQLFFFDLFDGNQKKYYGKIDRNMFKIRRSQKFFSDSPFSKATGKIYSKPKSTQLDISVIGWNWFSSIYFVAICLIFGLALKDMVTDNNLSILIMLIPLFLLLLLIPMMKLRSGLKNFEKFILSDLQKYER